MAHAHRSIARAIVLCAMAAVALAGPRFGACSRVPDAPGEIRLEFWTLALSTPALRTYVRERIEAFEQLHSGVRIEWVDVPFDALDRKLIAAAAAGRAPDVVNLSDIQFGRYIGLGALADLRPLLAGRPEDVYLPGALSLCRIGDGVMGLPWYLTTQVGYLNTELLARGGLSETDLAPDWEGLRAQAVAYHQRTGGYLFSQPLGAESQLPIMMLADGIIPFRETEPGRLEADLTRPDVAAFVGAWVDLYRGGAVPPEAATRDHSHLTDMYKDQRLAMIDTGPNFLARVRDAAPTVFERTRVRPGTTGALRRQHIAAMVVGVCATSPHPKEAAAFAWFITGPESQTKLCALATVLPSTSVSLGDDIVRGESVPTGTPAEVARARALAARSLPNAVEFTPALVVWPDLRRAFEEGIKAALLDGADVRATLAGIQEQWSRILRAGPPADMRAVPRPGPTPHATGDRP